MGRTKMAVEKSLLAGLEELRKHYGDASVFGAAEQFRLTDVVAVSTGSFNLDDAIGIGGWPEGRIVMISGVESSGKSLLALMAIKEIQKNGGAAIYFDAEQTYTSAWGERLGIDNERLILSQTSDAKEVFELIVGKPKNKRRSKAVPGILTPGSKFLDAGVKSIVIDSVNSLIPPMEAQSEVGSANIALLARFLSQELKRVTPLLKATGVTLFCIMQARENPGQMYGDAITVSGGRALKHAASLWVDLGVIGGSHIHMNDDKDALPLGHKIRAKIRKNKVAPPFRRAEYTIYYQRGIDIRPELTEQAIKREIITKTSSKTFEHPDLPGGKILGANNLEQLIATDRDFARKMLKAIKEHKRAGGRILEEEDNTRDDLLDLEEHEKKIISDVLSTTDDEQKQGNEKTSEQDVEEAQPDVEFNTLSKAQLLELGKAKGITGLTLLNKDDIISKIQEIL